MTYNFTIHVADDCDHVGMCKKCQVNHILHVQHAFVLGPDPTFDWNSCPSCGLVWRPSARCKHQTPVAMPSGMSILGSVTDMVDQVLSGMDTKPTHAYLSPWSYKLLREELEKAGQGPLPVDHAIVQTSHGPLRLIESAKVPNDQIVISIGPDPEHETKRVAPIAAPAPSGGFEFL